MADILSTAVSGLEAFQQALAVTSNNITNANTPGYNRETVQLSPALAQNFGTGYVGSGVDVNGVTRSIDQFAQAQSQSANESLAQQTALVSIANQVDSALGSTSNGIASALSSFYGSLQTLSTNPSSASLRSAVLAQAQSLAQTINQTGTTLAGAASTVNGQVSSVVGQINSLTSNIAAINTQIAQASTSGAGQAPNTLLDQRDQLVSQLGQLVGVRTNTESNGMIDVYVGSGQALVVGNQTTALSTAPNTYNANQTDVVYGSGAAAQDITTQLSGGSLSGYLQAQSQIVTPALNGLGQIATAVATSINSQQAQGATANNTFGGNLFSLPAPTVTGATTNTGTALISAAVTNVGALSADNYVLKYNGAGWSATDAQTGATVAVTVIPAAGVTPAQILIPAPSAANTLPAVTLTLTSGTPAAGDSFLLQPTAGAATGIGVSLTDPNGIAAGGLSAATPGATNAGSAALSGLTAAVPGSALPAAATTITFTSPTQYTITIGAGAPSAPANYTPGATITANGLNFQISGAPAAGDTLTIPAQTGAGAGTNNSNALAMAELQTGGVLAGGTTSTTTAYSTLVGQVGTQVQTATTAQTALQAVATQATQRVQSTSGVNLDEEGANLIQWQNAYTAAGRVVTVAESLFTTLLTDIQNG